MTLYYVSGCGWLSRSMYEWLFGDIGFLIHTRAYYAKIKKI